SCRAFLVRRNRIRLHRERASAELAVGAFAVVGRALLPGLLLARLFRHRGLLFVARRQRPIVVGAFGRPGFPRSRSMIGYSPPTAPTDDERGHSRWPTRSEPRWWPTCGRSWPPPATRSPRVTRW